MKKNEKKRVLAAIMAASILAGCGGKKNPSSVVDSHDDEKNKPVKETADPKATPEATAKPEQTAKPENNDLGSNGSKVTLPEEWKSNESVNDKNGNLSQVSANNSNGSGQGASVNQGSKPVVDVKPTPTPEVKPTPAPTPEPEAPKDTVAPEIFAPAAITILAYETPDFGNIVAYDAVDGIVGVRITGEFDSNKAGVYPMAAIATDAAGNTSRVDFDLIVKTNEKMDRLFAAQDNLEACGIAESNRKLELLEAQNAYEQAKINYQTMTSTLLVDQKALADAKAALESSKNVLDKANAAFAIASANYETALANAIDKEAYDKAVLERNEAADNLENSLSYGKASKETYDEATSDYETVVAEKTALEAKAESLEKERQKAESSVAEAKTALEGAESKLETATENSSQAKTKYDEALATADAANAANDAATAALNEALKAQTEAKNAVDAANKALSEATASKKTDMDAYNSAKSNYEAAKTAYSESVDKVKNLKESRDTAANEKEVAKKALDEAKTVEEKAAAELLAATTKAQSCEKALADANSDYQTAETNCESVVNDLTENSEAMQAAKQAVEEAMAALAAAQAQIDLGSVGFFNERDTAASDIIAKANQYAIDNNYSGNEKTVSWYNKDGEIHTYTQGNVYQTIHHDGYYQTTDGSIFATEDEALKYCAEALRAGMPQNYTCIASWDEKVLVSTGDGTVFEYGGENGIVNAKYSGDATNLQMMRRALECIRMCNEIRESDPNNGIAGVADSENPNKAPLMVSDRMMALAQIEANAEGLIYDHWLYFPDLDEAGRISVYGENLAAYNPNNPYEGWMREKNAYEAGDTEVGNIGHYQNIANPDNYKNLVYTTTGVGVGLGVITQDFAGKTATYVSLGKGETFTVDEYIKQFDAYCARVYDALRDAQAALEEAQKYLDAVEADPTAYLNDTEQALITQAEKQKADALKAIEEAQSASEIATTVANEKLADYTEAESARKNAEALSEEADAAYTLVNDNLNEATTEMSENLADLTNAESDLTNAQNVLAESDSSVADALTSLNEAEKEKATVDGIVETKQNEADNAAENLEEAQDALDSATTELNDCTLAEEKATTAKNDATANVESATESYELIEEKINNNTEALDSANESVEEASTKFDAAKKDYENAQKAIDEDNKALEEKQAAVDKIVDEGNKLIEGTYNEYVQAEKDAEIAKTEYDESVVIANTAEANVNSTTENLATAENEIVEAEAAVKSSEEAYKEACDATEAAEAELEDAQNAVNNND